MKGISAKQRFNYWGDEIYFKEEPALVGKTYGQALLAYEDSALLGLSPADGGVRLNPGMDTLIAPGDKVITVSEDDDTIRLSNLSDVHVDAAAIHEPRPGESRVERTLILGWNRIAPAIVQKLDHYVPPGSAVTIVADRPIEEMQSLLNQLDLHNQSAKARQEQPTNRRDLDKLNVNSFHHVITLGSTDILEPQQADAHALVTLLHLRDISEQGGDCFSIVSEMADVRNRALAEVTRADDFIVSDRLVSLMLSQISENKGLAAVFRDLFDPEGSELYLKPVGDYVDTARPMNFYTVVEAARQRGETAIGYRVAAESGNPEKAYGVMINPAKSELVILLAEDRVIVLAES